MNESALKQGQKIDAIFCPEMTDGSIAGGAVGYDQVTEIEIGRCAGPMGWYDVAIVRRAGVARAEEFVPVHMAEYVRLLPPANGEKQEHTGWITRSSGI